MKKQFLKCLAVLGAGMISSSVLAGVAYPDPAGGWTYIYNGDKDTAGDPNSGFTSLDGTWSHDNGSDQFDGSKIGGTLVTGDFGVGNSPGGMMSITEGGVTFLRMQDAGNPTQYGYPDPPSNRKIFFGHDISAETASDTILDEGVTLTFRARIPTPAKTTGPLDQLHRAGQSAAGPQAYPATGDGYLVSDGGKGNVTIKQAAGGAVAFALTVPADTFGGDPNGTKANFSGLTMNKLNGTDIVGAVNFDSPGEFRGVQLDPTEWHEFWITIKQDTTGVGNYEVSVYVDGSNQPTTLIVTSGNGSDFGGISYIAIGGSRTDENWALDLDFIAWKAGVLVPPAPPTPTEPPKISSAARQGDKLVITWTGGGTLQTSASLPATWTDVAGATTSPATVNLADLKRFYRIRR
ncbi:MAG: hypothetical protein FJ403_19530 [Verrucomicrobia bacterium]|nr:hypothetical protein [Verrucomicrobiota bacterium]